MISVFKSLKTFKRINTLLILCVCCFIVVIYRANGRDVSESVTSKVAVIERVLDSNRVSKVSIIDIGQPSSRRNRNSTVRWTYTCSPRNACIRREAEEVENTVAFEVCWLTCGSHGSVWPFPRAHIRSNDTVRFLPEDIQLAKVIAPSESVSQLIHDAFKLKHHDLHQFPGLKNRTSWMQLPRPLRHLYGQKDELPEIFIMVSISTNQTDEMFTLSTDEAYEISISEEIPDGATRGNSSVFRVTITGSTFFGIRHGIETFSQLIAFDSLNGCLQILQSYYAYDAPDFPYRGILIDSSRNFIPMNVVFRVVDGMAMNKLNILHMHLSDSNTFPFYSKRVPQISDYGALSPDQIYYPEDLEELVQYANLRGVKVIPELDAPSHAGNGWQFGPRYGLGDLAFYINDYDGSWTWNCGQPPCGILNPLNNKTYDVLENLYADLLEIFDNDLFHMGGDEVNLGSWKRRPELKDWLDGRRTPMDLWKHFQTEAFQRLKKQSTNVTAILWTSHLTEEMHINETLLPKDYIIQVWGSAQSNSIENMIKKGYSVIVSVSDLLYLDWGCGTWLGNNHMWKYLPWQKQYDSNRNFMLSKNPKYMKQVLGAEAPLWGEKVGPDELEVKIWPRAAALAESFWSNPKQRNHEVYSRINYHNYRMRQRGIPTSQLQPESCLHFQGHCESPNDII